MTGTLTPAHADDLPFLQDGRDIDGDGIAEILASENVADGRAGTWLVRTPVVGTRDLADADHRSADTGDDRAYGELLLEGDAVFRARDGSALLFVEP